MATLAVPIATSFHSLPLLAWLAAAYLIAAASVQPLCGKLTDIYSRRSGLLVGSLFFALGNLACGLATERWMMIMGRVLAGIGGGSLNSIAAIVTSDLFPPRRRGTWQGFGNVFWGVGNGLGGVFGGYLNDTWGWKTAFLLQVPWTAISATLVWIHVDGMNVGNSAKPSIRRLDFLGSFLILATLIVFMLGLTTGGNIVPWSHPLIITSFISSAVLFCLFLFVEQKVTSEPIISIHLMLNRTVACTCLTSWFHIMIVFALLYSLPIYYRIRGASITNAGAALIPYSVTTAAGSMVVGLIIGKTGKYQRLLIMLLLMLLLGSALMSTITLSTHPWLPLIYLSLIGLSFGGTVTTTVTAGINAVKHQDRAVVTSLIYTFQATAGPIGIALSSAVFQNVLLAQLWSRLGRRADGAELIHRLRNSLDVIGQLPEQDQILVRGGYMVALRGVFLTLLGLALLSLACGLGVQDLRLHGRLSRDDADADDDPPGGAGNPRP